MGSKCLDCEFCFPHEDFGYVCSGDNYGEDISKTLEIEKDCYSEGLEAFIKSSKQEEIVFLPEVKIAQLKIDGRKNIELIDKEGKIIEIKFSTAKSIFGDIEILRKQFDDVYLVNAVFNEEPFNGSRFLIIR